jgi:LCP family protein required for cell wall assembly
MAHLALQKYNFRLHMQFYKGQRMSKSDNSQTDNFARKKSGKKTPKHAAHAKGAVKSSVSNIANKNGESSADYSKEVLGVISDAGKTTVMSPAAATNAAKFSRDSNVYKQAAKGASSKKKKIVIGVVCAILILLLCAGAAYFNYINQQLTKGDKTDEELSALDEVLDYSTSLDEPFYMLLIGSDRRENDASMGARSDVNIVCRVDPQAAQITMVSIPRDTKIELEGHGTQKFNAAYAFDGAAGAVKAAEELLDIDISHYAEVNFSELANLIDAVGGVTVNVEERVDDSKCDDYDGNHYVIELGEQTLSGAEALTFSRSRNYPTGDFVRQKHQRQVVSAVVDKVTNLPLTSIPETINAAVKCVTTDLNVTDIIGLAQTFASGDGVTMYSAMLPSYTQTINGISFVINDEELSVEMMEIVEAGGDPSGIESTKTASSVTTTTVDTSNVLLYDDDDEVVSGTAKSNYSANTSSTTSSGGSNSSGTSSGGSTNTGTTTEAGSSGTAGATGSVGSTGTETTTEPSSGGSSGGTSGDTGGGSSSGGTGGGTDSDGAEAAELLEAD